MSNHDWISRASDMRPSEAVINVISAMVLAAGAAAIMFMERAAQAAAGLLDVLGSVRALFSAFLEGPIVIVMDTAQYVAYTLTQGEWAFFGPLTFAVGLGAIAAAFWVWAVFDPPIPLPGFLGRWFNRNRED